MDPLVQVSSDPTISNFSSANIISSLHFTLGSSVGVVGVAVGCDTVGKPVGGVVGSPVGG